MRVKLAQATSPSRLRRATSPFRGGYPLRRDEGGQGRPPLQECGDRKMERRKMKWWKY